MKNAIQWEFTLNEVLDDILKCYSLRALLL